MDDKWYLLWPRYLVRLIFGYLFGALLWLVVVSPYQKYYDFTFGLYWPELAVSLSIALIFCSSLCVRSLIVLFLPSMVGGATQNYIIVLLFTALVTNPLASVGMNSVESVRVIGCSLVLTFEQLSERSKLVLNPILGVLNEQNQTDLDPIRQDLIRVQHFIGEIRQNAQLVGESIGKSVGQEANATEWQTRVNRTRPAWVVGRSESATNSSGIDLEWDPENFGIRASIDVNKVRKLAKAGKLDQYLGHQDMNKTMNLTGVLYSNCMNIFKEAKRGCQDSVDSLYKSCESYIGPYLAFYWCSPFTSSLDSFCPWIMRQLVDEKSLCNNIKVVNASSAGHGIKLGNNQTIGVDEAFQELNKRIDRLNKQLLIDGDDSSSAGQQLRRNSGRMEIHLTFNEQTRRVFRATKSLIDFISDRYKMRQLLINALKFSYDVYTTYTFLLIMLKAYHYRRDYLANIKYDNFYITDQFIELDKRRSKRVLPLTKSERKHFITTFTCRRRTHEESRAQRVSVVVLLVFLAFALSLFYLDNIFYSLLTSIYDHSLVRYKELGHHELDIRVRGDGVVARLVKRLTGHLNSVYKLDRYTSTKHCLPQARMTSMRFYVEFIALVALYFLIEQVSIYAKRLRPATCAYFYPAEERERIEFLRKFIQYRRHKLASMGLDEPDKLDREVADGKESLSRRSDNEKSQNKPESTKLYSISASEIPRSFTISEFVNLDQSGRGAAVTQMPMASKCANNNNNLRLASHDGKRQPKAGTVHRPEPWARWGRLCALLAS